MSDGLILHGYWRSSAAYRLRIALNLKRLDYGQVTYDLKAGAQKADGYLAIAPHGLVPALVHGETSLIQSPAILEWLNERYPRPDLLPADLDERAIVRAMTAIVTCDIHPLNNLRVLDVLRDMFGSDPQAIKHWIANWVGQGLVALEKMVVRYGQGFCFGDAPTMADCALIPQLYSARRFSVDLASYPALVAVGERAATEAAFAAAHPDRQPDADHPRAMPA